MPPLGKHCSHQEGVEEAAPEPESAAWAEVATITLMGSKDRDRLSHRRSACQRSGHLHFILTTGYCALGVRARTDGPELDAMGLRPAGAKGPVLLSSAGGAVPPARPPPGGSVHFPARDGASI